MKKYSKGKKEKKGKEKTQKVSKTRSHEDRSKGKAGKGSSSEKEVIRTEDKSLRGILVVLVAVIILNLVYGLFLYSHHEEGMGMMNMTIGATTQELSALIWIADEKGYFADNWLDVEVRPYDTGIETRDALLKGEIEIGDTVDFVISTMAAEKHDFLVVASTSRAVINHITAKKSRGISNVKDLKGKSIALKADSSSEYYLGRTLILNNLSIDDVQIVHAHPTEMPDMLAAGEVDAAITWHPHNYDIAKRLGDDAVSWSAHKGMALYWVIFADKYYVHNNPEKIDRLVRALIQAEDFVEEHPKEAMQIVAKRVSNDPDYMQYLETVWDDYIFEVELQQSMILALEDEARWQVQDKAADWEEIPNYVDIIYFDALDTQKPGSVTIIH
ncbi:transporter substrate-binding domain-containing protein [Candidatus Woesearchaeota archaeon]|nr:transporter substrate-binding domain-containing protein [Candidatus Woesearchaeota archaeon]